MATMAYALLLIAGVMLYFLTSPTAIFAGFVGGILSAIGLCGLIK